MKKLLSLLTGLLLVLLVAGNASAVPITFDFTGGNGTALLDSKDYTSGGLTVTATADPTDTRNLYLGSSGLGVDGSWDGTEVDGLGTNESIYFNFDSDVQILSVGFSAVQFNDDFAFTFNSQYWDKIDIPSGNLYTFSGTYIGDEFQIGAVYGNDDFYISSLTVDYTAPVPEPATMMLFGLGLLGLAGVSRKKS